MRAVTGQASLQLVASLINNPLPLINIISGCPSQGILEEDWLARGEHCKCSMPIGLGNLPPVDMPHSVFSSLMLLLCWELWKHRHNGVFKAMVP